MELNSKERDKLDKFLERCGDMFDTFRRKYRQAWFYPAFGSIFFIANFFLYLFKCTDITFFIALGSFTTAIIISGCAYHIAVIKEKDRYKKRSKNKP